MADPRFFDNRGPFTLAEICAAARTAVPDGADGRAAICDLASLSGAGPSHLAFYTGQVSLADEFAQSHAGFCLVAQGGKPRVAPPATLTIPSASVSHAFAAAAALFYPDASKSFWTPDEAIDPTSEIGAGVTLATGVVIGPAAVIGEGTRLGPGVSIGRGVLIGRDCEISSQTSISHAYVGDRVTILPGVHIGQSGFGFASDAGGHVKTPQLGRVIIQDEVEIGAATTIDRGALGDTVIGEGTKIDNLVQIGHNVHLGRHCVMAAQAGIAGSCMIGDFVIIGGQVALGEYAGVGDRARLAARSAVAPYAVLAGGADYGGLPAKPVRDWIREVHTLARLAARQKRDGHD